MNEAERTEFLETVWQHYAVHGRHDLPWRRSEPDGAFDPYKILVSELMLQQTQVGRVIPKYTDFLVRFPTVRALATAELGEVLRAWQGLGYNRRAKYLWLAARQIAVEGWPNDLTELPGVGVNTAGAIRAYAFNEPAVFIETNIRTVYIYHFAHNQQDVPDTFIRDLLSQTLKFLTDKEKEQPRDFYWALMDYGSFLKTQVRNLAQSKHYKRQSVFQGSRRQIRGLVIRELSNQPLTNDNLRQLADDERLPGVLEDLLKEELIIKKGACYQLAP